VGVGGNVHPMQPNSLRKGGEARDMMTVSQSGTCFPRRICWPCERVE